MFPLDRGGLCIGAPRNELSIPCSRHSSGSLLMDANRQRCGVVSLCRAGRCVRCSWGGPVYVTPPGPINRPAAYVGPGPAYGGTAAYVDADYDDGYAPVGYVEPRYGYAYGPDVYVEPTYGYGYAPRPYLAPRYG